MKSRVGILSLAVIGGIVGDRAGAQQGPAPLPPSWAYGFLQPPPAAGATAQQGQRGGGQRGAPPPADTTRRSVPGSTASFTLTQVRDGFGPADWFPGDHPQMPAIVAQGRRDAQVTACALCHYPNGKGRPENAGIAGLPPSYFVQVMTDFKSGVRSSSDPRKTNTARMASFAKAMTSDEIEAAAAYFASMKWTPWVKVVEADSAPKTRIAGGMFVALEGADAGQEPIAGRIIEVPENAEADGDAAKSALGFHRLRSARRDQEGRSARDTWAMLDVPRHEPRRSRSSAWHCGSLADVHGASALRHATRCARRCVVGAHEARRDATLHRRHGEPRGVRRITYAVIARRQNRDCR